MTLELRRKQIEEILNMMPVGHKHMKGSLVCVQGSCWWKPKMADALLALLSDAECKGAWAVVRRVVDGHFTKEEIELMDGSEFRGVERQAKRAISAARQAASSFGPDPEGEGKV